MNYQQGGKIPGKAKVSGDSEKNDTVNIDVSPGEMVIPRTVVEKGVDAISAFAQGHLAGSKNSKYAEGGTVKKDESLWDKVKSSFEEDEPKKQTPVPKLDPNKAKTFSSVFNTDKYAEGGVVQPAFDPDKYLAEKLGQKTASNSSAFDPDKYLAEKLGKKEEPQEPSILDKTIPGVGGTGRGYLKGTLGALPTAGMLAGGAAGTALGPAGTVGGAGLGGAAGEALKNIGEKYLLGEEKTRPDIYQGPVKAGLESASSEMGGQIIGKGMQKAAESELGQKALGLLKKGVSKVGELFTGVPEKEIQTYMNHADEIKNMAKSSDNNTYEAAEQMRQKFGNALDDTRRSLNSKIGETLKGSNKAIAAEPILTALEDSKKAINSNLYPEQIGQIDEMVSKIKSLAPDGELSVAHAHDIKQFLQDKASTAYRSPGQPLSLGTEAARSAKSGAAVARKLVNDAEPAIANANNNLARLHDIEDSMNMNMISSGKPESALMAAGSGGNPRNAKALSELGKATGTDMLGDAEKLAAMRTFGSPKLMAQDVTGKAAGRMGLASGIGFLTGGPGAAVGAAAITSPAALRAAIDTGRITKGMLKNPQVQTMLGKGLLKKAEDMFENNK